MAFYTLLTDIGKAKLANATALGATVQLTHIAVGDGNGAAITPVDTATVLTHEVWRAALNSIAVDPANANWIVAEGYIPSTSGGFTVREVGLFDIDGDLIAIGNYPDTYKPTLAAGSAKDLYIKVIIEVTNSSTVTLKIDPAVVLSTRSYVDSKVVEHEAKADPHPQYLTAAKINGAIAEDPGDTDIFGFYDSFTGLLRKVSFANIYAILKSRFDLVYQAINAKLSAIASLTLAADKLIYATGANTFSTTSLTAFARTLLDDADLATMRNTLGIVDGIGVGQTWQDMTALRAAGTTYTNTTGKTIMVSVRSAQTTSMLCNITVNGFLFSNTFAGVTSHQNNTVIVPSGATYAVAFSPGSVGQWLELR